MKILITYSSVTGNTETLSLGVGEKLKAHHEVDIVKNSNLSDFDKYDLIILGYWVDKGTANAEAKKIIKQINHQKVLLIGTIGADPNSEYGKAVKDRVDSLLDISNQLLGSFLARGKVADALAANVIRLYKEGAVNKEHYDATVNSRPTNQNDIKECYHYINTRLNSLRD